jgi:hypothetical protein
LLPLQLTLSGGAADYRQQIAVLGAHFADVDTVVRTVTTDDPDRRTSTQKSS